MSQLDKDAAKRAATGESLGAFITFDLTKLDREELIQIGMRETLTKYLAIVMKGIQAANLRPNPEPFRALTELKMFMQADCDAITEALGRSTIRKKTAVIQEIPREPAQ